MKRNIFVLLISLNFAFFSSFSQESSLNGRITDFETGEGLPGATIMIKGTITGTTSDYDGYFTVGRLSPGKYTIVVSYISYQSVTVIVEMNGNNSEELNLSLLPEAIGLEEVVVKKIKRTDTDLAMLSSIRTSNVIASGISAQQISRSQDKDAAEVIRRVPGITITDGKFVVVRGLMERYNSILLNGVTAPGFEPDKRAFSFDAIPSSLIENIMIVKSPVPELPADFAGASINIITKNPSDDNKGFVSYSTGYNNEITFNDLYTYDGGNYDWLGFDDGTRNLPSAFPSSAEMTDLFDFSGTIEENNIKKAKLEEISKNFNNNAFSLRKKTAIPDQGFSIGYNHNFKLKKVTLSNLTSLNYSYSSDYNAVTKAEYKSIDPVSFETVNYYYFPDEIYTTSSKAGLMHNWLLIFGNNQRIEFRNYLLQLGKDKTILRSGENYYVGSEPDSLLGREMNFEARTIYSGQLNGKFNIEKTKTSIDWITGYSFTSNDQPDTKRLRFSKQYNPENGLREYRMIIPTSVVPYETGRLYLKLKENMANSALNLSQSFHLFERDLKVKAGLFYELKNRSFTARNIGIRQARSNIFSLNTFTTPEVLFVDSNFRFNDGIIYGESYKANNSYTIDQNIAASYIGIEIPVLKKLIVYTGLRMENYKRVLSGFQEDKTISPDQKFDTLDFFFSGNINYEFTKNHYLRISYGKTVNRPEFREIAPFAYVDFQRFATIYGNKDLTNSYIHNFDLRYEWYPAETELISISFFYKKFKDPIEMLLYPGSNGWEYIPFNTENSEGKGIEIDIRKRILSQDYTGVFSYLKNLSVIFNASFIRSKVKTSYNFVRDNNRPMMGQSPYIVNAGLYYISVEKSFSVSVMYNRIGERIVALGSQEYPNTMEAPRNSIDITYTKNILPNLELKAGIKNLLNAPFVYRQEWNYQSSGVQKSRILTTESYTDGRIISIGFNYRF